MPSREEIAAQLERQLNKASAHAVLSDEFFVDWWRSEAISARVELAEREQPAIAPQTPADARVKELSEALEKYGNHPHDCGRWHCWHDKHTKECCTCGFDRARAVLSEG